MNTDKKQLHKVTRTPHGKFGLPQTFEYHLSPAKLRRLIERMNARDKYFSWAVAQ